MENKFHFKTFIVTLLVAVVVSGLIFNAVSKKRCGVNIFGKAAGGSEEKKD